MFNHELLKGAVWEQSAQRAANIIHMPAFAFNFDRGLKKIFQCQNNGCDLLTAGM